ncbi:DUF6252 family protein [Flavobacterium sp.]|uniref:DUF6252 family protein n=1 Tax=Flavobacterium sp. TaxID=239 RepID=UPI003752B03F
MKTIKKAVMLLAVVLTSSMFVNCSSDSNNTSTGTFYMKCKVNGVLTEFTNPDVINSLSKSITGSSEAPSELVTLFMPLTVATGTFNITSEPSNVNSYGGSYSNFATDVYSDNETGTMTITQVDANVIKGTFAFTGTNGGVVTTVTEGEFRAENIQ